jgi:hypothetical protein
MKRKINNINNFLICLFMFGTIAPVDFNKILIIIIFCLILFRFLLYNKILFSYNKVLIFSLIVPGIILTAFNSPQDLIRFIIILFIIFGFPFAKFKLDKKLIMYFSCLILVYVISTQMLIASGIDWVVSLRDTWYFSKYSYVWADYNIIDFSEKVSFMDLLIKYRPGGLFHNPNVLSSVVLLYFFIFDACYSIQTKKNKLIYLFIFSLTFFSLLFAFSRTAISGFLIYLFIKNLNLKKILQFKIYKGSFLILIFLVLFSLFMLQYLISGFAPNESLNQKISILFIYLKKVDLLNIFFGGNHDSYVQFDAELSNWIGAVGFVGIVGFILLLRKIIIINQASRPFIIAVVFMSIGNTVFYGLLSGIIALIYLLIISSDNKENFKV